jgi:hypothetical protein
MNECCPRRGQFLYINTYLHFIISFAYKIVYKSGSVFLNPWLKFVHVFENDVDY